MLKRDCEYWGPPKVKKKLRSKSSFERKKKTIESNLMDLLLLLFKHRVPPADRNGSSNSNTNAVNGYANRNVLNNTNPVANPLRTQYARNQQHTQQYPSYQPSQYPYQQPAFQPLPEMRRIDDNVIRLPHGPDGTTGFMLKR